ncbi:Actin-interacting protein 1 [Taenia crassiceps]|uniref:Actin-interacting protein 1 n=1 Tax=Taenia crassiceps TaxID=6207 RepID=A0ABR4QJY4_9CEST
MWRDGVARQPGQNIYSEFPSVLYKLYPAVPYVERGKHVIIGAHPKGGFIVYPNKKNVIIRDLSVIVLTSNVLNKSGKLHIWDTTQKEHILKNEFPVLASINDVCWSSDNQRIAVGGAGGEKFGKVINAEMGTEVGEVIGMSKVINSIDFKPTRPFRLVTGSEDFTACFFEGPPFKFVRSLKDHTNFVQCCKFSPKGDIFATGGSDGKIFVYDASSGDRICELGSPAHKGGIYGLDFSPSGARLISVSADKKIKLWSAEKPYELLHEYAFEDNLDNMQLGCVWTVGTIVSLSLGGAMTYFKVADDCSSLEAPAGTMFGHSRPIQRACYSTTSEHLITASYDGLMVRWNLTTGLAEPFEGKEAHKSAIHGVVTCDDRVLSAGVDDRVVFSSLSNRAYEQSLKVSSQPRGLCLAASKKLAVVICMKNLYTFSLAAEEASTSPLACLEISPDATAGCITADGGLIAVGKADGCVELFVVSEDGRTLKASTGGEKVTGECTAMAFSPDGVYLAVGDADRYLRLYKVEAMTEGNPKLTQIRDWREHAARVTCVAWTPDGQHFATGGLDCAIMVFSPTASSKVCEVRNAHPGNLITALVWKSSNELISTGHDACNAIRGTDSLKRIHTQVKDSAPSAKQPKLEVVEPQFGVLERKKEEDSTPVVPNPSPSAAKEEVEGR